MPEFTIEVVNGKETQDFLNAINDAVSNPTQRKVLFRSLGDALVEDVKHRIITRDGGSWAPASKWSRAKSGQAYPTLLGAEKYVKSSITADGVTIYGDTRKGWTLTQHQEGFVNKLQDADEETDDRGRVVIKIKDGRPLNLYTELRSKRGGGVAPTAQVFAFIPQRPGVTPGRRIWSTAAEADAIAQPIASRWFEKIVNDAGGKVIK